MRFARSWLSLLLTALLLALSGTALAAPHYFCHMAGRVVADCCCSGETATGCEQGVKAADCCERMNAQPRATADRTLRAGASIEPAALAATLDEPPYVGPRSHRAKAVIHAGRGPPAPERLFAVHCAFLI
jgi:hypothetical protein